MKKVFLFVNAILLIAFVSCEKSNNGQLKENIENVNDGVITKSIPDDYPEGYIGPYRTFIPDNGEGKGVCNMEPLNCFPCAIIIEPKDKSIIIDVFQVIATGKPLLIKEIFVKYKAELLNYIDSKYIDDIINEKALVKSNINGAEGEIFMIFTDLCGEITLVYPMIL